jgi:hypothetical protein
MKLISLSRGYLAQVDDKDYTWLSAHSWHVYKKKNRNTLYAERTFRVNGVSRHEAMHRLVLAVTDPKIQVDHKDGDGLNNQRHNLREATHSQNQHNRKRRRDGISQHKGVGKHSSGLWRARIVINKKETQLGYFHSERDAALAYNYAATQCFGKFARLNIVP